VSYSSTRRFLQIGGGAAQSWASGIANGKVTSGPTEREIINSQTLSRRAQPVNSVPDSLAVDFRANSRDVRARERPDE
jgi:hypothetical protein